MGKFTGLIGNPLNTMAVLFAAKAGFAGVLKSRLAGKSA
jgi:hypothetical protein